MNNNERPEAKPVAEPERIQGLDVLRGFALLGILLMNIQSFSMISPAYFNPTAYGSLDGIHLWVWAFCHLFADQKFMALFSILFGAGVVLFSERLAAKGRRPAGLHYRRTGWLILFGLLHAHLLWYGDILFGYGICALFVFLLRKLSPRKLLVIGLVLLLVCTLIYLFFDWSIQYWDRQIYQQTVDHNWEPTEEIAAAEIATYTGSWSEQMRIRVGASIFMQTAVLLIFTVWRAGGLMLIGMALFKWKILSGERTPRFYRWMALIGFGVGLPVVAFGALRHFQESWAYDYSMFAGIQFNYWGSLGVAAGYIGLVMLLVQSGRLAWLQSALVAVGRTAFSNYILQTLICTTIFYGHGLGLFGQVERLGQLLIVFAVWAFQLLASFWFLRHFRFGPIEWLWRSLTYWRFQPMRFKPSAEIGGA